MTANTRSRQIPKQPLGVAAILALLIGGLFLAPFFGIIVASVILAFTFSPLNKWFSKHTKRAHSAPALTLLTAFLLLITPLLIILSATIAQTTALSDDIQRSINDVSTESSIDELTTQLIQTTSTLSGGIIELTEDQIIDSVSTLGTETANGLLRLLPGFIGGIPSALTAIVLFIYIFLAVLRYQKEILQFIKRLNPLGDDIYELYLSRAGAMTNGMVRGQFLIAIVQGSIGAITFAIAGVPYIAFFFLILTFLSIIPLGSGIISLPVGIILLATGNIWQGLVVLLGHLILVTNIDNILRPILIPKAARLPSALTLIGVFAGLAAFGFLGIIIGPVLLILLLTTLEVYVMSKDETTVKANSKAA